MFQIDPSTDFGVRVARRLEQERIIWLTTVGPTGMPQPSPVWYLWDGRTFLIYSQPDTGKLHNIGRHPSVALNFDGDGRGGNIIIITGRAAIDPDTPPATAVPAYLDRYREGIARIGMTPEGFAASFSVAIRVTPTGLRGH